MNRAKGLDWPLKMYIGWIVVLGLLALYAGLALFTIDFTSKALALTAAFSVVIGLAGVYPIPLLPKVKASVTTAALFAAVLILPPGLAAVAAVVGTAAAETILKRAWYQVSFNSALASFYVACAGLVFYALNPGGSLAFESVRVLAGFVGAAVVLYTVNRAAVAGAAGLELRKSPLHLWRQAWREDLFQEITLLILGFLAALAIHQVPWTIGLFVIPVAIVYCAFAKIVELNRKVEAQMEELKAVQGQLVETAKMAAIGTLAAGVAHQVNNPIFVIRGRAELLLEGADRHFKSEKAKQHTAIIYQMADRVSRVVNSLLISSRPSDDGASCTDVHEALENVLVLLEEKFKRSCVRVEREYGKDLPLVTGDGIEIQELFMNLAMNGCDAMPNGGELRIVTRARGSSVDVDVIDTGHGIAPENIGRVFEPFFTTKEAGKGIGLGLFVVKEVVRRSGGSIWVDSEVGKGTKFTISLPTNGSRREREEAVVGSPEGEVAVAVPSR